MNYEKLTVDSFIENAQNGKYAGLTGARRAIGKATWNEKDKKRAHDFADKYFADGKNATKKEVTPRPQPKKAKKAAAAAAAPAVKKTAKKTAGRRGRAPATEAAPKRTPVTGVKASSSQQDLFPTPPRLGNGDDPTTVRQHAASTVIAAYRNTGELNPLEQRAYDIATAEYSENARESARRLVAAAREGLTLPERIPTPPSDDDASSAIQGDEVVAQPGAARIVVPPQAERQPEAPPSATLDPVAQAQHERLKRAAEAAKFPIPPAAQALDKQAAS
jgi:hypothetical protein